MKFEVSDKTAVQVGDISSNSISIDVNNIDFIVSILSTNLYSNPIESFIRETVSNAWDSHVEAGVKEPVAIELGKDAEDRYYCCVRDFGVGLSPERFNKIYRNIGSSTKRTDNSQIGGFGIGRFSALAYSEMVYITTNYDGKKYKYLMYKDGNSISIDLVHTQDTTETNGLEVFLYVKEYDLIKFSEAIKKQLAYFENLFIINTTGHYRLDQLEEEFNNLKIKKFQNFQVNTLNKSNQISVLLGKVLYPLRAGSMSKLYPDYIFNYPIAIKFEIGDLEVTPNREELLYSVKNVAKIEENLNKTLEEIAEIVKKEVKQDFTVFSEYLDRIQKIATIPLYKDDSCTISIPVRDTSLCDYTYKGKSYDKDILLGVRSSFYSNQDILLNYSLKGGKLFYKNIYKTLSWVLGMKDKIHIGDIGHLKGITKEFVRDTYKDGSHFIPTSRTLKQYHRKFFKNVLSDFKYKPKILNNMSEIKSCFKLVFSEALVSIKDLKIISDRSVTKEFVVQRDERLKKAKELRLKYGKIKSAHYGQSINLNLLRLSERGYNSVTSDLKTYDFKNLDALGGRIKIYDEKDSTKLRQLYLLLRNSTNPPIFFEVAPTKMKDLEDSIGFVKLDKFLDVKYKLFRQIGTAMLIKETAPYVSKLGLIVNLQEISPKLKEVVHTLSEYEKNFLAKNNHDSSLNILRKEIYDMCVEKNFFDEEIRALLEENRRMLQNAEFLTLLTTDRYSSSIPKERINFCVDYILARKLFRPSLDAVKKLREEGVM